MNMRVKSGAYIQLTVSAGKKLELMENFVGRKFAEAQMQLEAAGVPADRIEREDVFDDAEPGDILEQSVAAGERYDPETVSIKFIVSKGRETFEMPSLIDMKLETGDLAADILSDIAAEERAKVVYQYLYRQITDKGVRDTIDFLLNREEAHNTMFREAFNRIKDTGSLTDWAVTGDSKLYFDLSKPGGQYFASNNAKPPQFTNPN
jgi:hypothetical protein